MLVALRLTRKVRLLIGKRNKNIDARQLFKFNVIKEINYVAKSS